jgi:hypothetical protein
VEAAPHRVVIPMRVNPRDPADILLNIALAPWILCLGLLVGGPAYAAVYSVSSSFELSFIAGYSAFLGLFCLFFLPSFRSLALDAEGLHFRRWLGRTRFVPWASLREVEEVARGEVLRRVWLWPGIPPRGSIACMSARQQYRITWDGGLYYYAPRDTEQFQAEFDRYLRPGVVRALGGGSSEPALPSS